MPADFRVSITNAPGKDAYPIASFTYLLVYKDAKDKAKGEALVKFLWWAIHDGQKLRAAPLDYAPLPAPGREDAREDHPGPHGPGQAGPCCQQVADSGASAALLHPGAGRQSRRPRLGVGHHHLRREPSSSWPGSSSSSWAASRAPAWEHIGLGKFLLGERLGSRSRRSSARCPSSTGPWSRAASRSLIALPVVGRPGPLPRRDGAARGSGRRWPFRSSSWRPSPASSTGCGGSSSWCPGSASDVEPVLGRGRSASCPSSRGRPSGSATWPPASSSPS